MNKETTCCFTGHRIIGDDFELQKLIDLVVDLHKNKGVDTFICGGALGFDTYAAAAVRTARNMGYDVKMHIYVPCNNQSEKWNEAQKRVYNSILSLADYIDMVDRPYFDGCMKIRNYKMVDNSAYCIAYYHENSSFRSGTGQTVRYAKKCGLEIFNLAN